MTEVEGEGSGMEGGMKEGRREVRLRGTPSI